MSAGRVPGAAGVLRVLDEEGGAANLGPLQPSHPGEREVGAIVAAERNGPRSETVLAGLVELLAAVLPNPALVGRDLLDRFGSLGAVLAAPEDDLAAAPGMTRSAARLLGAAREAVSLALTERFGRDVIADWATLEQWVRLNMGGLPSERLVALYLDRKNGLIRHETLANGTVDHVPLYPREVARRALMLGASAVVLAHNHPSGDPTPSPLDIETTRKVADGLALFEIALHDHAVVGRRRVVSMRAFGLL